jgi:alpha 1,2-mannosyltransferase
MKYHSLCIKFALITFIIQLLERKVFCESTVSQTKESIQTFWNEFEKALLEVAPLEEQIDRTCDTRPIHLHYEGVPRPNLLHVPDQTLNHLKQSHSTIVDKIDQIASKLTYNSNTSGIVMTCSKDQFDYQLVSLRMLRRTGSKLPVEVFLASPEDYSEEICEKIYPSLNAKCRLVSDIHMNVTLERFQYKVFAMLFSSFENILFLDADNLPILNLDDLMTTPPFTEYGMVTWIDFWAETISPYYFSIIDRPAPENVTHYSCESGQLLLSKKTHAKTLLLATYYNIYGYGHYYRLFTQNGFGEGDKETFYAAADFYRLPYYRVVTNATQMNYLKIGNFWESLAMIQPHPTDDWKKYEKNESSIIVRPLFIHANYYKLSVNALMKEGSVVITEDGYMKRIWASKEVMTEYFGYDIEKSTWDEIIQITQSLYPHLLPKVELYYRVVIEKSQIQPALIRDVTFYASITLITLLLLYLLRKHILELVKQLSKKILKKVTKKDA